MSGEGEPNSKQPVAAGIKPPSRFLPHRAAKSTNPVSQNAPKAKAKARVNQVRGQATALPRSTQKQSEDAHVGAQGTLTSQMPVSCVERS